VLTIYHVQGTRSLRPIWLCYELGLPVEIVTIDFSPAYRNSAEWRAISPGGKVPALRDGDLTMFESGAMVDYVLERYGNGRLRPLPGTAQSALHHQWCWFAEATLIRPIGINRFVRHKGDGSDVAAEADQKTRASIGVVEGAMAGRDYLLGAEFGAVDIMMGYSLELLATLKVLDARYPNSHAYLNRLRARDAFQRTMRI
jgi:glutathione S-transferase